MCDAQEEYGGLCKRKRAPRPSEGRKGEKEGGINTGGENRERLLAGVEEVDKRVSNPRGKKGGQTSTFFKKENPEIIVQRVGEKTRMKEEGTARLVGSKLSGGGVLRDVAKKQGGLGREAKVVRKGGGGKLARKVNRKDLLRWEGW